MNIEEIINKNKFLEQENKELKEKLKKYTSQKQSETKAETKAEANRKEYYENLLDRKKNSFIFSKL